MSAPKVSNVRFRRMQSTLATPAPTPDHSTTLPAFFWGIESFTCASRAAGHRQSRGVATQNRDQTNVQFAQFRSAITSTTVDRAREPRLPSTASSITLFMSIRRHWRRFMESLPWVSLSRCQLRFIVIARSRETIRQWSSASSGATAWRDIRSLAHRYF